MLVLPFEYYTTSQLEATNEILEFLNLTQIDDEKHILKVPLNPDESVWINFGVKTTVLIILIIISESIL